MNKLAVASVMLLLSGCQTISNEARLDTFIIGDWEVESVMGARVQGHSHALFKFFKEGKVSGSNGCNNFFGQYSVKGDKVKLIPKGSTMMMCPESIMRQADLIDKTMPLVATAEMKEDELEFFDSAGNSLFILSKL